MKTKIKSFYNENRDNLRTIEKFTMNKLIPILASIFVFTIVMLYGYEPAEAEYPKYKTHICNTNKCKARVERLNECNWDIDCAVKLTQDASYDYLYKELHNLKKESSNSQKIGLKDAIDFTVQFEWLRLEAYFDWYANWSNRRSICYGTKSYKWETATQEECKQRKMAVITPIYNSIPSCFNDNQKIALTSYIYNTGWNQMNMKYHLQNCRKKDVRYIMQVWWHNKELKTRRNKELLKYNS